MNKTFRILVLLCISQLLYAQEKAKVSLKLYNAVHYTKGTQTTVDGIDSFTFYNFQNTRYGISPAVQWTNNTRSHEIAITQLAYKSNTGETSFKTPASSILVGGFKSKETNVGLRYEYASRFNVFSADSKFDFNLGLGASPSWYTRRMLPVTSNSFQVRYSTLNFDIVVVPHITYDLKDKWFIDFNIPIYMAELRLDYQKVENPSFTSDQQRSSTYTQDLLPRHYELRLGLGYKL